ncbi:MAG TPA: 23S rRNA (adenine(2503)-C(2))-methyltransferase RlmN [Candidatus Kapabacteria bacterium]|nr:23S rRNA (adenine(2503)-C(2))-methyltransferase RlmN [Candidatus Kapabacteria bacterium]
MSAKQKTISLFGMSETQIAASLAEAGLDVPRYRSRQIYNALYGKRIRSFAEATDLPRDLREQLDKLFPIVHPNITHESRSIDGTIKYLFELSDARTIEAVLIPSEMRDSYGIARRKTLCLSTQVGCPLDCKFCATATLKLKRDLTTAEIIAQYFEVERASGEHITNVVYMGMGEPMLNYDNVVASLRILTDKELDILGSKRITVSTSGLPDEIRKFAREGLGVKLALSLHATTDELRSKLMPINRRYPLAEVISAMEEYYKTTKIPVTYEYILFAGLNDTPADAKRLAKFARRMPSKVNVIPFHPIDFTHPTGVAASLHPSTDLAFKNFISLLKELGAHVMVRSSAGVDIEAACGQLALSNEPHLHEISIAEV